MSEQDMESELIPCGDEHVEFQGALVSADASPIGLRASVEAELTRMFPGLAFKWSPSGIEKLAIADTRGIELPAMVRRVLEAQPSSYVGSLSISFAFSAGEHVTSIFTTIGGAQKDVEPVLARLAQWSEWRLETPDRVQVERVTPNGATHVTGHATMFVEVPESTDAP